MALRAGYKGFKKLLPGLKIIRPGTLGIDNGVLIPELNKTFFSRSEQAVLGAKNRLTFPYLNMAGTIGSLAWTANNDGSISIADGTISANDTMALYSRVPSAMNFYLPKGRYKFTVENDGTITGGTAPYGCIGMTYNGSYKEIGRCNLNGELDLTIDDNFQCDYKLADGSVLINVYFQVFENNVLSGFKIKPMISFDGGEFVPPAMTNRELSEVVNGITVKKFTTETLTIAAGAYTSPRLDITNGDLIPIGIVGYTLNGTGNTNCSMWKNWISLSSNIYYAIFGINNYGSGQASIQADIFVLYKG